ncbi:hypothetical protein ABTY61_28910 [Kitasatospora sp. NPDC096128]|uniref:hypothetical protein n=1 Tax=Kitasatospora sp. NPDC096128 TaxID=3155547 RepID=UPI00331A3041
MSKVTDLKQAQQAINAIQPLGGSAELVKAIQKALAVPGPAGNPDTVSDRARDYAKAAKAYAKASTDIGTVATTKLPAAWTGAVAEHATQAVRALANELDNSKKTLEVGSSWLVFWACDLGLAQSYDRSGVDLLKEALKLATFSPVAAPGLEDARAGVEWRIKGAELAQTSGTRTASMLNQLAARARTERAGQGNGIDPLAAMILANEKGPGGSNDGDYILTPNQLDRANLFLAGLGADDQARFRGMLSGARSPEEAAYLWKALAAGHTLSEVEQFGALIHPHGDDPNWLAQHLVPALRSDDAGRESTSEVTGLHYLGKEVPAPGRGLGGDGMGSYSQGGVGDCVAASTVVAALKLDPVTMLQVTTGNTPEAPGADSSANFERRLQQLYISQYQQGQAANGDQKIYPQSNGGVGPKGNTFLANQNLGRATGETYEYVDLGTEDDRRAAVARIEKAVDEGKPVPFCALDPTDKDKPKAHQMVIIARDGNRLQVYNPWGRSEWVTEDQFIHSQVNAGRLTDDAAINMPYGAELPK